MSRLVKRVPANWKHPRNWRGKYIPFYEMPQKYTRNWDESELTHYMMYEWTDETPMSPAFETPEELAQWLTDTEASFFGGQTTDYDHWLYIARGGCGLIGLEMSASMDSSDV